MKTHRELYPEQYQHALCGKSCRVVIDGKEKHRGTVSRVVASRFGRLAVFSNAPGIAYALPDVRPL